MKGKKRITRAFAITLMVLLGILAGCAKDGNLPLAPQDNDLLDHITFLPRTSPAPVLAGDDPIQVSFTVTPREGGSGEVGFATFVVRPGAVTQEVTITVTIEDPNFYVVELSSKDRVKFKKGTLSIHVESRDVGTDDDSISVYMETRNGWRKLPGKFDPEGSNMKVNIKKFSRYALSRE